MAEHLDRSWLILDQAIGPYREALARVLGCARDTIDAWCVPPPGFTRETASARGRRNPLDDLAALCRHCPDGLDALRWLAEQLGYRLIPAATTPVDGQLLRDPATIAADVDALLRDLARKPARRRLSANQFRDLRDRILDGLHSLVEDAIDARRKGRS